MKINQFLKNAKNYYKELVKHRIVIGNQSADLDSIVSSISLAFYFTNLHKSTYIPVINSEKEILKSKKECLYLFESLSIDLEQDFVFISDWRSEHVKEIILVDHNELDDKEKELGFADLVSGIIDHREDKNLFLNSKPRIIDKSIGSNTSIIAEFLQKSKISIDESLAFMMLFPILADTNNLTCRADQKDIQMVEFLRQNAKLSEQEVKNLYNKIEDLKFSTDFNSDNMDNLFKKDYKQYKNKEANWGMSSVCFSVKDWKEKNKDFNFIVENFMSERGLYFYGILSCFKESQSSDFKRDLILFGDETIIKLVKSNLPEEPSVYLSGEQIANGTTKFSHIVYDIGNVSLTRKYWQPLLENILAGQS